MKEKEKQTKPTTEMGSHSHTTREKRMHEKPNEKQSKTDERAVKAKGANTLDAMATSPLKKQNKRDHDRQGALKLNY